MSFAISNVLNKCNHAFDEPNRWVKFALADLFIGMTLLVVGILTKSVSVYLSCSFGITGGIILLSLMATLMTMHVQRLKSMC